MDLDGSLLNSNSKISSADQSTLQELGKRGVIRVIATGRNLFSAERVLGDSNEFDYLVISTGLGILDYQSRRFLKEEHLSQREVEFLIDFMLEERVDFMIHNVLPDNHYVLCHDAATGHPDFRVRRQWYKDFATDFKLSEPVQSASQFIGFFPHCSPRINELRQILNNFNIVRTTSPITYKHDWMEIFPKNVSKGHALSWLCKDLNINLKNTLCLGNDYNDLDMLKIAGKSYVTLNAPTDLKREFNVTVSNNDSPLTEIVREYEEEQKD